MTPACAHRQYDNIEHAKNDARALGARTHTSMKVKRCSTCKAFKVVKRKPTKTAA